MVTQPSSSAASLERTRSRPPQRRAGLRDLIAGSSSAPAPGGRGRVVAHVLVGAGVFALVLAALLPTVVYPRLAVLPADPQQLQMQRTGSGTALVPDLKAAAGARVVENVPVSIGTFVSAAGGEQEDGSVVWNLATRVQVEGHGLLQARVERISLDRRTGLATNCCGDTLVTDTAEPAGEPLRHEGYLTFPFDTQKQSYPLWDIQLRTTREARYLGEERRAGLRTYRFSAANDWAPVQGRELPGSLFGLPQPSVQAEGEYKDVRTFWVEPATGAVVDMEEQLDQRYRYGDRTVTAMSADLRSDPMTADLMSDARSGATVLPWLRGRASVVLALVAAGLFLLAWRIRSSRPDGTS